MKKNLHYLSTLLVFYTLLIQSMQHNQNIQRIYLGGEIPQCVPTQFNLTEMVFNEKSVTKVPTRFAIINLSISTITTIIGG